MSSNTNSASTLPALKEEREELAWIMSVLQMATRQLALVNKTGQVNFEVNIICRGFIEWIRNIISQHFMPFFSSMLLLSYDRVIAGYLTRQVATTFMSTCARHYAESSSAADANAAILMDMETAPVTLHSCNLAVCNAITHLVDTNLILVNQLIREKLGTPVVDLELLIQALSDEPVQPGGAFDQLFQWVGKMVMMGGGGDVEFSMGYILVNKLGSQEDYQSKEAYLESYFGIAKGNYYTYMTAVKECCSKVFDLSTFLGIDNLLDFTRLQSKLGVGSNGAYQSDSPSEGPKTTYLFNQPVQAQQGDGPQQRSGVSKCWVNMIQHLLITSLQGSKELHADNIFSFGARLSELIFSRCAPQQSLPMGAVVFESFEHVNEEVIPLVSSITDRPEYFVRTINDQGAIDNGQCIELPPVIGAHPPEDTMHLGSWVQLYGIIHSGERPQEFQYLPNYNGRPPELVLGWRYPLLGADPDLKGTIMLSDHAHKAFVTLFRNGVWEPAHSVELNVWWDYLKQHRLMVGPLIHRQHAAFRSSNRHDTTPWVAVPHQDGQFINGQGEYLLARSANEVEPVCFTEAHLRLIPLGAHLVVEEEGIAAHSEIAADYVVQTLAYLRYPETLRANDNPYHLYVVMTLKSRTEDRPRLHCLGIDPGHCTLMEEQNQRPPNVRPILT